jgi:polysaccharide export outer membrane protein
MINILSQKMVRLMLTSASFLFLFVISSCKSHEIVYFQKADQRNETIQNASYTPVFKKDDFLSIIVTGEDLEATIPFNLPVVGAQPINNGYTFGNAASYGYLIDSDGKVTMPFIGSITIAGLNRIEATTLIQQKLSEFLKNPVVHIQILNYKVTVLGDVRSPGTFKIPNERITILEALGLAGDLKMTGKRNNVLVVRDENGEKTQFRVDLTSHDLFISPVYYLKQNDVVYVEPNNTSKTESTLWRATGSIFISLTTLIITTINILAN